MYDSGSGDSRGGFTIFRLVGKNMETTAVIIVVILGWGLGFWTSSRGAL